MTGIALLSAKGAPGVTTCAVLLAAVWPTPAMLVEADPAGGDLRSWYTDAAGTPLRADVGVVSLLSRQAAGAPLSLSEHCHTLPGGLAVLVGPETRTQFELLRAQIPQLAAGIRATEQAVLVDLGRVEATGLVTRVLEACAFSLVVCRPTVASIRHTRTLLAVAPQPARVLLIGAAAQRRDAAQALGVPPEQVLVLADDPVSAAALAGGWTRRLDRSPLVSSARQVASLLHAQLGDPELALAPQMPVVEGVGAS
jgi:hypothetical protein